MNKAEADAFKERALPFKMTLTQYAAFAGEMRLFACEVNLLDVSEEAVIRNKNGKPSLIAAKKENGTMVVFIDPGSTQEIDLARNSMAVKNPGRFAR